MTDNFGSNDVLPCGAYRPWSVTNRKGLRMVVEREREREREGVGGGGRWEVKGGIFFAQGLQINTTLHHLDLGDTDLVSHIQREKG